ncbi:MAG: hypothetical protein COU85_01120 [Candidatus Portnoybacteria bacterium CG10_big_fil_rev_8_21_14_0_10_44_7]|uniref:ATP-grasp domain-containing protein n=1 Tax=Candidatus Portnoybacteria bacterium CG10_big_fil_rev_8_21_14_0_10_44_7 TaxID=1974816 RepID=A0A2M8KJ16_9BACT|nr:MAG: hypothetical protein COU85_01120 [Candidatus Portnoybacteria bacterium CG10_big_fil_rev_8_21_14_0_10_44_7]
MTINNFNSIKAFFAQKINRPIFGVGVWAFNRLGLEGIFPHYRLLCLRYSPDTALVENRVQLLSLEKGIGAKHLNIPRNSTSVLLHPQVKKCLQKFKKPLLLPYKASKKMERVCRQNDWILGIAPTRFGKKLFENKIVFRQVLEKLNASPPPGLVIPLKKLNYERLKKDLGLPFVLQHPTRGGGKGTFFIRRRQDFALAYENIIKNPQAPESEKGEKGCPKKIVAAKFIVGSSPSITVCVTRYGILNTNLQEQILDIPELFNPHKGSGLFCGHDWTFSRQISQKLNRQANAIAQKIGRYFQQQGYHGIFGLDFVADQKTNQLYTVECNPRMTGAFPTLEMALAGSDAPPLLAFHALEYLDAEYNLDLSAVNRLLQQPKMGAHLFLHNLTECWAYNHGVLRPGVYRLKNNQPEFLRPGYQLSDISQPEEFIVTEGVPFYKSYFSPNRRLCRVLTEDQVLYCPGQLNDWAHQVVQSVYRAFRLRPIRLVRLKKLFRPDYLAKE